MDKRKLITLIQEDLALELQTLLEAARSAHLAATHEESRPEDQHDTRGIEAAYLAGAQAQRAAEIKRQLLIFKFLPVREFGPQDPIGPGALVELELNRTRSFYFLIPQGGGLVTNLDGRPVQVITPQSPIGEALLGRKAGDVIEIEARSALRVYKVLSVR